MGMSRRVGGGRGGLGGRLLIAGFIAITALIGYFGATQINPVTQEKQHISMSTEQEIALGQQAAPQMASEYGGLSRDANKAAKVQAIGNELVAKSDASKSPYDYQFHLLADKQTINAFALPGGQIFITEALYDLLSTDGEIAGVLGHEIFHVVGRHSAEQAARMELSQGLTGAAVMASYDPNNPNSAGSAQVAQLIGQMVNMKYGRDDELESDNYGVQYMAAAGYDPRGMIKVMQVLEQANQGQAPPEFFSTHPSPANRVEQIEAEINRLFPDGVPDNLRP